MSINCALSLIIPGLFASSLTIKNSVVVSFSGRDCPFHSHSSCDESSTSFPCLIIFLTSKDEEVDELLGLKLGADDFIKKSGGFSIKVLIERIRVQLRKKTNNIEDSKTLIIHGKLKLDPSQLECEWNGKPLPEKLTTTEFLIVKELAKRPGIIKERAQLMDIAYKDNNDIEDRTIDSHVKRIRKKFKKVDQSFSAIETRYGSGYRWNIS